MSCIRFVLRGMPFFVTAFFALLFFATPQHAFAAVVTWDGGGGADTNWNTCTNWSGNACPTSADTATFDGTSITNTTVNVDIDVAGIAMNVGYGGVITQGTNVYMDIGTLGFIMSAGTFTGSNGNIDINGNLAITDGIFTSTSGSLLVRCGWSHTTAGTFNHGSGTVELYGATDNCAMDFISTETFNNFKINKGGSTVTLKINTGFTAIVQGTTTLMGGELSTGTINALGPVVVEAGWGGGTAASSLLLDGTNSTTMTVAGGAQEPADTVTLNNANLTVQGSGTGTVKFLAVTLQNGTVNLGSYTATMTSVTQSGGTLNTESGTVTFSSTYGLSNGIFNANTGTVTCTGLFTLSGGTFNANTSTTNFNGGFTQSNGTYNGGSATVSTAAFTLSTGTYNASSGTSTFTGAWTHTAGGTFNHMNGSVVIAGISSTYDVMTTETFYNVQLNGSANTSTRTIATSDTLVVAGIGRLTNGLIGGGGILDFKGPVTVDSTWDGAAGTMHFTGVGTETVAIPAALTAQIANVIVINAAGYTLTGSGGSGTLELNTLTVQAGTWDSSGYDETHSGATTVSGGTYTCGLGVKTFTSTFNITNGTFNGGSATLDFNAAWTLTDGIYNASTGTSSFASGFTYVAGTFTHNSGISVFDTTMSTITPNSAGAGSLDFGSVTFAANPGTSKVIQTGDTMVVNGTLTLSDGLVTTGTLDVKGNIDGAVAHDGVTAPLILSGSNVQNITLTGAEGILNSDIAVNKSGGSIQLQSALTLDAASQDLTIQEGTFDLNNKTLTVNGSSGKLVVESGGVLRLQGGETITANATYPQLDAGSVVYYDGTAGPYNLKNYSYQGLTLEGGASTAFIPVAALVVAQNLTITSGALSLAGYDLTVSGTFSNEGSIELRGTETTSLTQDVDSGSWVYIGDGDGAINARTIKDFGAGADYYNLRVNVFSPTKDTFALGANLDVDGELQVSNSSLGQGSYTIDVGSITVNGGTLTGGSAAITLTGSAGVTINSGTFTSTSNTLTVVGPWTHTVGGTFTHNSGTVAFTGNATTVDVATAEIFSALTINMTDGQTLTVASGDSLVANGTLSLTNGNWGTGTVSAQGNIVVASTWDANGLGMLEAKGGGTQTLNLTGAVAALDNPITINKSGGSLTLASDYTMDAAGADFTLTLGTFSAGSYAFTAAAGSDITVNGGTFDGSVSTMVLAGTLDVAGGTFDANTSTATYNGAVTVSGGAFTSNTSVPTFNGSFLLSSGTYQGADSGDAFAGGLTISGGTFTATSGVTTVSSDFTHTAGGTFAHGDGTVAFTGNDAAINVASTETFNALQINKNDGQTLTIAAGDALVATGTLTLTNGAAGTGTLEAQAGVTVGAGYDGGNAALKFSGGAVQTLNLTGVESLYNGDIEVAKSAETLTLGSALTMDAAGQDLTITSGGFSTSGTNYGLTVAGNAWLNGGTTTLNSSTVSVAGTMRLNGGSATVAGGSLGVGVLQLSNGTYTQGTQAMTVSTLTVDGGTFTGGGGTLAVGAVDLSLGTLTAPTGIMTVTGSFSHTLGTFNPNGGTVAFTGNTATADVPTTETFANLTVNKTSGQTLTIGSGDTLAATGTLSLTDGGFATGGIAAQGNVVVGAQWDAAGTGVLSMTGGAVQLLDLTGAVGVLDNPLTINKSGGSVTLASDYTLDAAGADFTLTLGTFATGDFAVTTSAGSDIAVNGGILNAGNATMTFAGGLTVAGGTYNGDTSVAAFSGAVALSSGAYNGSANGDLFSGGLTISGGVFTASDATTTISGAYTHTDGGTFTHNSGTVQFTGAAAVVDVASSETFAVLTVSKNHNQTLTVSAGDALVATGTLTLTNGAVGTGTLEAQAGVTVGAGYDGGNAALKFSGGEAQTFSLTGATAKYDGDIEVAKSSNTVSLGSALVMDAAGQDLTLTSGTLSTSGTNYSLSVVGNVAVNGGTLAFNGSTVDMDGDFTVAGGAWNGGTSTITLAGTPTYASGTMTPGTSLVTLDGTDQEIVGNVTFASLSKVATAAPLTLTLPASGTVSATGTLTLLGADAVNTLSLRSSTNETRAKIAATGTVTAMQYLSIQDSWAEPALRCLISCVNESNNLGWTFTQASSGSSTPVTSTPIVRSIAIMSPAGGTSLTGGAAESITWTSQGVTLFNIDYSLNGGTTWHAIAENLAGSGTYRWTVPNAATESAQIRIEGTDLATTFATDVSDAFTIVPVTTTEIVEEETEDEQETTEEENSETSTGTTASGDAIPVRVSAGMSAADVREVESIITRLLALPAAVPLHGLVKLADDGDPLTFFDSAVYYVGADGKRHAFPNEFVYKTWFCNFADVRVISVAEMADIDIGSNITYRPGTRMVKFTTAPKVYVVDRYGTLRWVATEELAHALYGAGWNTVIDDVSDAFYGNYTFSSPLFDLSAFDPDAAQGEVRYPSDSIQIPGYEPDAGDPLVCEG